MLSPGRDTRARYCRTLSGRGWGNICTCSAVGKTGRALISAGKCTCRAPPRFVPDDPPTLFYDDSRHVLELLPVRPEVELSPPAGLAVDVDGAIYRVNESGVLVVRRCDESESPLVCEACVLLAPAGLA